MSENCKMSPKFSKYHQFLAQKPEKINWNEIIEKASKRALGSGGAGASAMVVQVCSLMWMRTIMNYQYRYGTSTAEAARLLYKQGGIRRFYRGVGPALLQGPLSRFSDTGKGLKYWCNSEICQNLTKLAKNKSEW